MISETADTAVRLCELVLENGRCASPFVWRIRYALAHKRMPFESVPIGLTDIPKTFGGRFKTIPVLEHGSTMLAESWDIAEHLDRVFSEHPPIFAGGAEKAMVRLMDSWFAAQVLRRMYRIYVLDVYNAVRREDREYFRQSHEARLKDISLESFTADRAKQLPIVREALQPLREQLSRAPFWGGDTPNYADYIALAAFQWVASVSTLPLLSSADDTLRSWLDRGFDLYGGLGRDSRMKSLFE